MTRKRLSFGKSTKDFIENHLRNKTKTPTQLATLFGCHPKSINRVAKERGVLAITAGSAIKAEETKRLKRILTDAQIPVDQISQLLMVLMKAGLTDPERLQKALIAGAGAMSVITNIGKQALERRAQVPALLQGNPPGTPESKAVVNAAAPA